MLICKLSGVINITNATPAIVLHNGFCKNSAVLKSILGTTTAIITKFARTNPAITLEIALKFLIC